MVQAVSADFYHCLGSAQRNTARLNGAVEGKSSRRSGTAGGVGVLAWVNLTLVLQLAATALQGKFGTGNSEGKGVQIGGVSDTSSG